MRDLNPWWSSSSSVALKYRKQADLVYSRAAEQAALFWHFDSAARGLPPPAQTPRVHTFPERQHMRGCVRQVRASTRLLQSICRNLLQDPKLSADEGGNLSRVAAVPVPAAAAGRLSVAPGLPWYTSVH